MAPAELRQSWPTRHCSCQTLRRSGSLMGPPPGSYWYGEPASPAHAVGRGPPALTCAAPSGFCRSRRSPCRVQTPTGSAYSGYQARRPRPIMEGQALDARPLHNFIVAGQHTVIGVLPDPDVLTATPVPVAAVKPLPHTRTVARYALRRSSCPAGTPCVRSSSNAAIS